MPKVSVVRQWLLRRVITRCFLGTRSRQTEFTIVTDVGVGQLKRSPDDGSDARFSPGCSVTGNPVLRPRRSIFGRE